MTAITTWAQYEHEHKTTRVSAALAQHKHNVSASTARQAQHEWKKITVTNEREHNTNVSTT